MDREWELQAACRSVDPDVFFSSEAIGQAQQTCKGCPVRMECLEAALVREDGVPKAFRTGLVAGLTGPQRWKIAQQRKAATEATEKPPAKRPQPKKSPRRQDVAPCGTPAAYQRHIRKKEPVDQACRDAYAASKREYRRTGSTKVPASR
ncbi:WhiB family transcriptional regulator [Streptomyces olindensis]|uniref:WhiB family transcriptional regulator n=1 Tax=Streptomyces olindensis TaxID=358823 RepID=UPI00367D8C4F